MRWALQYSCLGAGCGEGDLLVLGESEKGGDIGRAGREVGWEGGEWEGPGWWKGQFVADLVMELRGQGWRWSR